jgi:hypothetical protein
MTYTKKFHIDACVIVAAPTLDEALLLFGKHLVEVARGNESDPPELLGGIMDVNEVKMDS